MLRTHKHFTNSGGIIVAITMVGLSIALFMSGGLGPFLGGIFLLALALLMLTTNEGVELDLEKNQFRNFSSTFFIRFGKWKKIPTVVKATIYPGTRSVQGANYKTGASFKSSKAEYLVRLHPENSKKSIIISRFIRKEDALAEGKILARHFQVELVDTELKTSVGV